MRFNLNSKAAALIILVLCLSACSSQRKSGPYTTLSPPHHRNTYTAQRLNDKGLRAIEDAEYDQAEEYFRQALDADLFFAPAHNNLGLTLLSAGRAYEAAWEFQFAAKLQPHAAEPRNNLGLVMEKVAHLDDAIEHYSDALRIEPENIEVMGNLARARIKAGEESEDLRNLLKRLTFQDANGTWDQWARRQMLSLGQED